MSTFAGTEEQTKSNVNLPFGEVIQGWDPGVGGGPGDGGVQGWVGRGGGGPAGGGIQGWVGRGSWEFKG